MITRSKAGNYKLKSYIATLLTTPSKPTSISQALTNPKCYKAMQEEFQALQVNNT